MSLMTLVVAAILLIRVFDITVVVASIESQSCFLHIQSLGKLTIHYRDSLAAADAADMSE